MKMKQEDNKELKTHKEIFSRLRKKYVEYPQLWSLLNEVEKEEQAEAVKWVKGFYRKCPPNSREFACSIEWIKHFFNLTEGDLK